MSRVTPTLLLIIDGWGQAPKGPGNAVVAASMPNIESLLAQPNCVQLACSGRAVGLPNGFMGNSEVGHLNIGAGRSVNQDITRIDLAIEEKKFASNHVIHETIASVKKSGGRLHIVALLTDGGVHSHIQHLFALIDAAQAEQVPVIIQVMADGRDAGPTTGIDYMRLLLAHCTQTVRVGSICGRYFAMDRDARWERVKKSWDLMLHATGEHIEADTEKNILQVYEKTYAAGKTDEFVEPVFCTYADGWESRIQDNDGVFFLSFRADRARQMSRAFADPTFTSFERGRLPELAALATMTAYDVTLPLPAAFPRDNICETLGEVVSTNGLRQFRIAETEKYAHVTYFFNGGAEEPFEGEERCMIASPRDVATYDLKPEMSVAQVTQALLEAWNSAKYDLIVCNFANLDMVGHTGNFAATVKACEVVDGYVGQVMAAVKARHGRLLVTADHGNAEEMLTAEGLVQTAHSKNPVALAMVDDGPAKPLRMGGKLGDIAPTILDLWGIAPPKSMTGKSLWEKVT